MDNSKSIEVAKKFLDRVEIAYADTLPDASDSFIGQEAASRLVAIACLEALLEHGVASTEDLRTALEEGPGQTDRPQYAELKALLQKIKGYA